MNNLFEKLLNEKHTLLADGATGTNLFAMGLQSGDAPELWNIDQPQKIARLYRDFIDAGSDIVLTNTFGGTRYRLKLHNAQDSVSELNIAATEILKAEIANSDREIITAGSIGPTGEILAPLGDLEPEAAVAAFAEQALALKAGGADVIWIETMSSAEEVEYAVKGAGEAGLPVVFSMSFDTNGRTMMGVGAFDLMSLERNIRPQVHACGTNCGIGASEVVAAVLNMKSIAIDGRDPVIIAKANCGIPKFVEGKIVYTGTPEIMANYAVMVRDAGARIIGGCCGTSPVHVRAMRQALDNTAISEPPTLDDIDRVLGKVSDGARAQARGEHEIKARVGGRKRRRR
ncbi:MAG: betaine--homocysteine S-methyltransferase [Gammaproteobacteria bacterium]|nr:betaine--homocysteine S-methyltransferase [Gammaproteobacteria bacterium]MCZ6488060.1 betaine--homocysteine S-methyltransferase [Gammaproteobacteria bacterium]MCZ6724314.1 betaine--homocysteine S-methyltransferase [Gammaproteobacteria bacterium]MCZ6797126.1 betaine--homocysteine S-methyltransferase [Gammaproteobacteria bacterium]MCZ6883157.1 betaine--homocysteine S-methyltransferase [Gammaproteobacteria bacterium]